MDILFLPYTIGDYLSNDIRTGPISTDTPEFESAEKEVKNRIEKFVNNKGTKFSRFLSIKNWVKLCGINVGCQEMQKD